MSLLPDQQWHIVSKRTGMGTLITLNGSLLHHVRRIAFSVEATGPNTLIVELIAADVRLDIDQDDREEGDATT